MNRDEKAAAIAEIASDISESQAIFAVDPTGLTVAQAAEIRTSLRAADARLRVVKNTLTERAADEAGADSLKEMLEGPTAFTFVPAEGGDIALAAKAISQFRRANDVLEFKGGLMNGEPLSVEQIEALAKLPGVDVLRGQLVGVLASPITGLVRGLNQLIAGLAIALGQIQAEGKLEGNAEPAPAEEPASAEAPAEDTAGDGDAAESDSAAEAPGDPVSEAEAAEAETETETEEAPSEGEEKEG